VLFRFDGSQIMRAVTFHLLDLKRAKRISNQSLKRTLTRLNSELRTLALPKDEWVTMTDSQRLAWLLEESRTAVQVMSDGTAMLSSVKEASAGTR
jgi:hypothetical protein